MTGTQALRGSFGAMRAPAGERRVAQWAVQALLPWAFTVIHPSVWGLAVATAQLVFGGSLLVASGARLRLVAPGSVVLAVAGHGIDLSDLMGDVAQMVRGGLESALLIVAVSLLLGAWRSRTAQQVTR